MWTQNAAPIVKAARKRASLYLSHLKCARQLIVTNHIRESAEQSTRRQYNGATGAGSRPGPGVFVRAREGAGASTWFLPSDGSLFRALYAHVHARTPTFARANERATEKNVHTHPREYACLPACLLVCVYVALLVSRAYELGGHQKQAVVKKEKRKKKKPRPRFLSASRGQVSSFVERVRSLDAGIIYFTSRLLCTEFWGNYSGN